MHVSELPVARAARKSGLRMPRYPCTASSFIQASTMEREAP